MKRLYVAIKKYGLIRALDNFFVILPFVWGLLFIGINRDLLTGFSEYFRVFLKIALSVLAFYLVFHELPFLVWTYERSKVFILIDRSEDFFIKEIQSKNVESISKENLLCYKQYKRGDLSNNGSFITLLAIALTSAFFTWQFDLGIGNLDMLTKINVSNTISAIVMLIYGIFKGLLVRKMYTSIQKNLNVK